MNNHVPLQCKKQHYEHLSFWCPLFCLLNKYFTTVLFVCFVWVSMRWGMYAMMHVWWSEKSFGSWFFLSAMGFWSWTQVTGLGNRGLYQLGHLTSPSCLHCTRMSVFNTITLDVFLHKWPQTSRHKRNIYYQTVSSGRVQEQASQSGLGSRPLVRLKSRC